MGMGASMNNGCQATEILPFSENVAVVKITVDPEHYRLFLEIFDTGAEETVRKYWISDQMARLFLNDIQNGLTYIYNQNKEKRDQGYQNQSDVV